MKNDQIEMIIPTTKEDYLRTERDLSSFFEFLPISTIIFIGPESLEECVVKTKQNYPRPDCIQYLNENDLIANRDFLSAMKTRLLKEGYSMGHNSRPGWYYQQFLKMAFSEKSSENYYMTWDADTIPLREIEMFDHEGKPFFDIKPEYMPGYFLTIKKLFKIDKQIDQSFISEHMIFNAKYMQELISEIENMDLPGDRFYEKIIYAIDINNMKWGFSEFETFGNWMVNRYPDVYALRNWSSIRLGGYFLDSSKLGKKDIQWLSEDFDAITFEGHTEVVPDLFEAFFNEDYRKRYSAAQFYTMLLESGIFGEYKDGMRKAENGGYYPV